jgi:hypothetical protein
MGRIFEAVLPLLDQIDPGEYVEIGTSRQGDDGSTSIIAEWAGEHNTKLISIDMDPVNCKYAENMNLLNATIINSTGEQYLKQRPYGAVPISFLYLDNFDWDHHPDKTEWFVLDQQKRYAELGFVMNNVNCQAAHIMQMSLALPHMAKKCIVACDDTPFNRWWGHFSGKCGAVVPFLIANGFDVLYMDKNETGENTGIILGRGFS